VFVRLTVDGAVVRTAPVQTGTGMSGAWPVYLTADVAGTGAAMTITANVYSPVSSGQILGSGDGASGGGPVFRYKVR
jgi:hypothetical protein